MKRLAQRVFWQILRCAWPVTVTLLVLPMAAGIVGTLLPAFGFFPALGGTSLNLDPGRHLFELPGLWTSVRISFVTGIGTTVISLVLVAAFCSACHGTRWFRWAERVLAPILSIPHAAVAFGLAFLLAPSGWILRLLSPWATGFTRPPDWLIIHDPNGFTLMAGLIAKEVPYLLVMTLAALGQADAERIRTVAATLGYRPVAGWLKVVFPAVYPQIRLPVFAVLAYGLSVVDVALILGPTTPLPLAPRLVLLFNDPDLTLRFVASAGALLQLGLVIFCLIGWIFFEKMISQIGLRWICSGNRGHDRNLLRAGVITAMMLFAGLTFLATAGMTIWSFAETWRFPKALPPALTWGNWVRHLPDLTGTLSNTITVALSAVAIGLAISIGALEYEARSGRLSRVGSGGFLYSPLLIPQVAFLFGMQILLVWGGMDGRWFTLSWVHLVFVFPYIFLSLSDAYRAWDERYMRTALCLGSSRIRALFAIKLPMLLRPIAVAGAVGFAVSCGLYLPTAFAGSGRYPTLTTEVVALSAGGDSRLIGLFALLQTALPFLAFALAIALPAWFFRYRAGMQVTR